MNSQAPLIYVVCGYYHYYSTFSKLYSRLMLAREVTDRSLSLMLMMCSPSENLLLGPPFID